MKKILFIIAICLSSCNGDVILQHEFNNETMNINFKERGVHVIFNKNSVETKSDKIIEEYILTVSNDHVTIKSLVEREMVSGKLSFLRHYTLEKQLLATLTIVNNEVFDIEVQDDLLQTKGFSSWWQCTKNRYKEAREWFDDNHKLVCDLADVFGGACVVGTAASAALDCAF